MSKSPSKEDRKQMLDTIAFEMNVTQHVRNWKQYSPFATLIRTLLSQNTTDKNAFAAFDNLAEVYKINAETLSHADIGKIQEAIRIAGLHNQKSQRILEIAKTIHYEWNNNFDFIHRAPMSEARKKLIALPGIGKKTADVLLNFCGNRPIMPVDTHITRLSKRLGFVPQKADYDDIRRSIEKLIPADKILYIHVSLIFFGRKMCKAIKPHCSSCPITDLCPKLGVKSSQ